MTDRELLEYAAKAAGYALVWGDKFKVGDSEIDCTDIPYIRSGQPDEGDVFWNPLADDGDALRLAVKLGIHLTNSNTDAWASTLHTDATEPLGADPYAATRLAIVRAAAEIGRSRP